LIVTPEYNHAYPAALKAIIDCCFRPWHAKPIAFVSYGGVSGGLRAVEQLRLVFAELHAVAIRETVSLAHAWTQFDPVGNPFRPGQLNGQLIVLMKRLTWWADALKAARIATRYDEAAA
jgi:NAD(P)H-dependent FMN reductase